MKKLIEITRDLLNKNIHIQINSGAKDAVNNYGFRSVFHLKAVRIKKICIKGCEGKGQDYQYQIHGGNCKWESVEEVLFFGFVEDFELEKTLLNLTTL